MERFSYFFNRIRFPGSCFRANRFNSDLNTCLRLRIFLSFLVFCLFFPCAFFAFLSFGLLTPCAALRPSLHLQLLPLGIMTFVGERPLPVSEHRAGAKHTYKTMKDAARRKILRVSPSAQDLIAIRPVHAILIAGIRANLLLINPIAIHGKRWYTLRGAAVLRNQL